MEDLSRNTSDAAQQVLFANNLTYTLPSSSSIATNRVMKRNYFQNRNYNT